MNFSNPYSEIDEVLRKEIGNQCIQRDQDAQKCGRNWDEIDRWADVVPGLPYYGEATASSCENFDYTYSHAWMDYENPANEPFVRSKFFHEDDRESTS